MTAETKSSEALKPCQDLTVEPKWQIEPLQDMSRGGMGRKHALVSDRGNILMGSHLSTVHQRPLLDAPWKLSFGGSEIKDTSHCVFCWIIFLVLF